MVKKRKKKKSKEIPKRTRPYTKVTTYKHQVSQSREILGCEKVRERGRVSCELSKCYKHLSNTQIHQLHIQYGTVPDRETININ